jgi:hypothetical protein
VNLPYINEGQGCQPGEAIIKIDKCYFDLKDIENVSTRSWNSFLFLASGTLNSSAFVPLV